MHKCLNGDEEALKDSQATDQLPNLKHNFLGSQETKRGETVR